MEKFGGDPPFLTYSSFSISICLLHKQDSLLLSVEVRFTEGKYLGQTPNMMAMIVAYSGVYSTYYYVFQLSRQN